MKIIVDRDRCSGNAICESIAPHAFQVDDDGDMTVLIEHVDVDDELVAEAVRSCPAMALTLAADPGRPAGPSA